MTTTNPLSVFSTFVPAPHGLSICSHEYVQHMSSRLPKKTPKNSRHASTHVTNTNTSSPPQQERFFLPHDHMGKIQKHVMYRSRIKTQPYESVMYFAGEMQPTTCQKIYVQPTVAKVQRKEKKNKQQTAVVEKSVEHKQRRVVRTSISIRELLN